ncbi:MAG TPA: methylated-DNA--[protein]-cysteine S-methyltransferase [Saprospiraceae bacterium]|nr:methylated-DNA--[protein]-cysteine S-methyltransferase [Saprospiraceae bacterium]
MEEKIYITNYISPFGNLFLAQFQHQLCLCDWENRPSSKRIFLRISKFLKSDFLWKSTSFLSEVSSQLDQYFDGNLKSFDIPLLLTGTDFQNKVWKHLQNIPYGQSMSYQIFTNQYFHQNAIRAVATANGANILSIIIPCHRVIGSDGSMTGYAGGLSAKEGLLRLEGVIPKSWQLDLFHVT